MSQSTQDSCKFPCDIISYTDRQDINCIRCLENESDVNKIILRKDSIISTYVKLDSLRLERINDYQLEVKELTEQKDKAVNKLKRTRKFSLIGWGVAVVEAFILILYS